MRGDRNREWLATHKGVNPTLLVQAQAVGIDVVDIGEGELVWMFEKDIEVVERVVDRAFEAGKVEGAKGGVVQREVEVREVIVHAPVDLEDPETIARLEAAGWRKGGFELPEPSLGRKAYEARVAGMRWKDVGKYALGYAKSHAKTHGLEWPVRAKGADE